MRHLVLLPALLAAIGLTSLALGEEGFSPLFDGKTLDGWHGDMSLWKVQDGMIVGSSEGATLTHNTFLSTKKSYKNFVLKIEFKLRNHNSGVQVRSQQRDDFVVAGYQADIADKRYMGILYEERGRGILADVDPGEVAKHLKPDGWNEYVITCDGPRLKFELNGFTTVDYTETSDVGAKEGIIALQLHQGPPMQVSFRNIRIKELP
ncbi:MAG: DUF1080 domain-containing protein [Thermoguttaceae bacterium]|nr:DUF1080 domain-containing protein [Thermoguttaceae bacterium]